MPVRPTRPHYRLRHSVAQAIARRNLSQNEFGRQCGLSSGYISQLITGTRSAGPGARKALMETLAWDFDELFEEAREDA